MSVEGRAPSACRLRRGKREAREGVRLALQTTSCESGPLTDDEVNWRRHGDGAGCFRPEQAPESDGRARASDG
jgi:hypothetical protein